MNIQGVFQPGSFSLKETELANPVAGQSQKSSKFSGMLTEAIDEVNSMQHSANDKMGALLRGETKDIHDTVLAVQQADTSFRLMMNVRNKIVEAYKEISKSGL